MPTQPENHNNSAILIRKERMRRSALSVIKYWYHIKKIKQSAKKWWFCPHDVLGPFSPTTLLKQPIQKGIWSSYHI